MAQWRFGTGWYYTIFCYWPTGWWWWNHFSHPCLSFRVSKTLLYLFWNLMKKRILGAALLDRWWWLFYIIIMTENHVLRKLFGGFICYQLFGKLFGLLSLFFPFCFFLWDSVLLWKNILFFFSQQKCCSLLHLLQLCLYLVTFIKFFMRENYKFSTVVCFDNF